MQFKHPEILYFLFLLLIPVLVHLFHLRRFKIEYFTNVRFLKEIEIPTRRTSKIKKWLLLICRLFLLAFIILAFAQPFFKSLVTKNAVTEMYIVVDNSFSMQAKGQKGELLKRTVEDLLEHTPENQNFSLITNSETFWNTDIKSIRKELQNLEYCSLPFQIESVMSKIKSHKTTYNKEVIIITDALSLKPKQLNSIDPDFISYFVIPKAEQKNNLSIDSVYIKQNLDDFYEIGIKIKAFGENFENVPLALYNRDKLIAKTSIKLDTKDKTVFFTIPKEDFHGRATITDNSLTYDNSYYFSISKPTRTNVISVGEKDKSIFLSRIYTNEEFNYANYEIKNLDYSSLENQDVILINELTEIPQALENTLKDFVEKGGNLILIPSSDTNINLNSAQILNPLLKNFGNIQFLSSENNEKLISKIAFNNPLFKSVFEKQVSNFQFPNTKTSFKIKNSYPAILSYQDQTVFLTAIQNPFSYVYVFAAPLNKKNSNFQNSPLIVPTFYNMAENSQKTGVSAIVIGDPKPLLIEASLSKEEIINIKNKTSDFIPIQQIRSNKVKITFSNNPTEAGNYAIYKKKEFLKNISFNYNRTESDLTPISDNLLSNFKIIDTIETVFNTLQANQNKSESWKWFVVLTLLFLVTEILIQKFVK